MAEKGASPNVPRFQRTVLRAVRAFTSPLLPDDYLELINPLWSTRELRGRIEEIRRETPDAATVVIRPGYDWEGHEPGQYLRIGIDTGGRRHWRAYSLTSDPDRPDGFISITVKNVDEGVVSPCLVKRGRPGSIVSLGGVEGTFKLPDPLPEKLLFVSAGSGITPIMSMLRSLEHRDELRDVVLLHSARTPDDVIFGEELRRMDSRHDGFRLHEQHTQEHGRITPERLDELCPDWREREGFISGPGPMLDAMIEHWDHEHDCDRLHMERFQPIIGSAGPGGRGRDDPLPPQRLRCRERRQPADPRLWRGGGARASVRLPRGHLPHLRGDAAHRQGPRPAHGQGLGRPGRDHPDLHQRPRGPHRNRSLDQPRGTMTATIETENPLHRLTPEQIEEIGKEFDKVHDQVFDDLGERDAKYIRSMIALHRRLVLLGRVMLLGSKYRPARAAGTATLSMAKILENMEIGHNVMHGQWDWMNDPHIHSNSWDWDSASTKEAWKHSHNYIHHTYTNIRGKDRDLGYEIMRIDPHQKWYPVYLAQPFYNLVLAAFFEWGVAAHDLNFDEIRRGNKSKEEVRRELKGMAGKARSQIVKDYLAWPALSGLVAAGVEHAVATRRASRRPRRPWQRRAKRPRFSDALAGPAARRSGQRCGPTSRRTSCATCGPTRSSSAATSRTRRTRSARRRPTTRPAAGAMCASCWARRTSRAARCST